MIIYHQLTMKLIKNVRNYLSGKVLTVQLFDFLENVNGLKYTQTFLYLLEPLHALDLEVQVGGIL